MAERNQISLEGEVTKRPYAVGSKSERLAVMLTTPEGQYRLRRPEGSSFYDPVLEALVGKRMAFEGTIRDRLYLVTSWRETLRPSSD